MNAATRPTTSLMMCIGGPLPIGREPLTDGNNREDRYTTQAEQAPLEGRKLAIWVEAWAYGDPQREPQLSPSPEHFEPPH